jgi:hypothetical protein
MGIAIVVGGGILATLISGAVNGLVVHGKSLLAQVSCWIIAWAWCIWLGREIHGIGQYKVLKPVPKKYAIAWKRAYAKVREILDRATYNLESRWHVTTSDTQEKHIHAILRFTDEVTDWDSIGTSNNYRTKRVKRLVEVDVWFEEWDESTVIYLDFSFESEGAGLSPCDWVIQDVQRAIDSQLGGGTDFGDPVKVNWAAPSWWLLGLTALGLMYFWQGVVGSVGK